MGPSAMRVMAPGPKVRTSSLICSVMLVFCACLVYLSKSYTFVVLVPKEFPLPPVSHLEKITSQAIDNELIVVATANYGMRDYVHNWMISLEQTGHKKYLVFCLDDGLYHHLQRTGYGDHATTVPAEWFQRSVAAGFSDYWAPTYPAITHTKTLIVQRLLYLGYTVLFSDVDIVWLKPRVVDFLRGRLSIREETQVLFQQEGYSQTTVNTGFFVMRPKDTMKKLLAETIHLQDSGQYTQQAALNVALNSLDMDLRSSSVVLLDVFLFPNGHAYFLNDVPQKFGVEPYLTHANYLVGADKRNALIKHNLWYVNQTMIDEDDHYIAAMAAAKQRNGTTSLDPSDSCTDVNCI